MLSFTEFLQEESLRQRLHKAIYNPPDDVTPQQKFSWVDIDDTSVHHDPNKGAKVRVKDSAGNHVKTLSTSEYNSHKLEPGQSYDYGEFASSDKFAESAHPIHKMVRHVQRLLDAGHHVHFITARADMDKPHVMLGALKQMGYDMDRIHLHRAGNEGKNPTHVNKARTLDRAIRRLQAQGHDIKRVVGYDDHIPNVTDIYDVPALADGSTLRQNHPGISFHGVHVIRKDKDKIKLKRVAE